MLEVAQIERWQVNEDLTTEKAKESNDRFIFDTTMENLELFKEGYCPANTVKIMIGLYELLNHGK